MTKNGKIYNLADLEAETLKSCPTKLDTENVMQLGGCSWPGFLETAAVHGYIPIPSKAP